MTGTQIFANALEFVLAHEGGYVHDPRDPGGETNFGISKRAYPHVDIRALTRERAAEIYHRDYWAPLGADMLAPAVSLQLFDCAVNAGVNRAVRLLQGVLNRVAILDRPLVEDGIIGPATVRALRSCGLPGSPDVPVLAGAYALERIGYCLDISERNPTLRAFFFGWIKRVRACELAARKVAA